MEEFFAGQGLRLEAVHDGRQGLEMALNGGFDAVLLDVMLPGLDGFSVLGKLRERSQVPVLMLTARTEQASRIHGLEQGADDYLPKPFDPYELAARVRAVLRRTGGQRQSGAATIEANGVRLDPGARTVYHDNQPIEVTSVEYDILETLVRSAGRVVSRDELTQKLYQRESTPFDRSIDVHISHLRRKLETSQTLIRTVRGVGYLFCTESEEKPRP